MKKVEISFVLDETGSMSSILQDTIGSFNTFIDEQRKLKAKVSFSLTLFSESSIEPTIRPMYESVPLKQVSLLTTDTYRPRGTTPLYDAIGGAIAALDKRVSKKKQVIMVILTDGEENASVEYTLERVKELVEEHDEWEFIFLGCGMDAFGAAGSMGIAHAAAYAATGKGVTQAYASASCTISSLVDP